MPKYRHIADRSITHHAIRLKNGKKCKGRITLKADEIVEGVWINRTSSSLFADFSLDNGNEILGVYVDALRYTR
jgi:hypothetical protein